MHSSRMRTVRFSGRFFLRGRGCLSRGCLPRGLSAQGSFSLGAVCPGGGFCLGVVSAEEGGVCPGGVCLEGGVYPEGVSAQVSAPPVNIDLHRFQPLGLLQNHSALLGFLLQASDQ